MLTSSFGWTPSPASVAITSLAFMFDDVPEPVWKTSIGNWSSSSPAAIRSAAAAIRSALSASSNPSSPFTRAAAALIRPSQRATWTGIGSPETGKLPIALVVSLPQSSRCTVSVSGPMLVVHHRHDGVRVAERRRADEVRIGCDRSLRAGVHLRLIGVHRRAGHCLARIGPCEERAPEPGGDVRVVADELLLQVVVR